MVIRPVVAALTATFLLISVEVSAAVTAWAGVVVRVYDAAGLSRASRDEAMATARAALVSASVDVTWIDCAKQGARCQKSPAPGELIVRLVNGRAPSPAQQPLGDALVAAGAHRGTLATIYVDRVRALAGAAGTAEAVLLGRAIAHELGHLLAGTTTHARAGLMREKWTVVEILRNRREDWIFR